LWFLLPLAIALAVVYFTGYDLRSDLLRLLHTLLNYPAVYFTLSYVITPSYFALGTFPPHPVFTILSAWCVLVGVAIHPRPTGRCRGTALLVLALFLPTLWFKVHAVVRAWLTGNFAAPTDPWSSAVATLISQSAVTLVGAAAIVVLFRARLVALTVIAAGLLGIWVSIEYDWSVVGGRLLLSSTQALVALYWTGWSFNPVILAAALWWAISARRAWKPRWACQTCGYDMRGALDGRCPECGCSAEEQPSVR